MNVLTIDIDYAYSPSISEYDDFVIGSRISLDQQKTILKENNCAKPVVNLQKFNQLCSIFNLFRKEATIFTVQNHHEIMNYLNTDEDLYIENIDHHHDIYYPGWHDLGSLDEGNWVYHISKTGKLKRYTWFRNKDSELFCSTIDLNFQFIQHDVLKIEYITKPDIIVLCGSPHWTLDTQSSLLNILIRGNNDNAEI